MRLVVFTEEDGDVPAEFFLHGLGNPQFLLQPHRHRFPEQTDAERRHRQMGFEQAFEGEERLVVKPDTVEVSRRDTPL